MNRETYSDARARLHRELAPLGWSTSKTTLKILWAEKRMPAGTARIWFKARAVYLNDYTLDIDIRGMSVNSLQDYVSRAFEIRQRPL